MQRLILAPLALALAGCITGGPIMATAGDCSILIPDSWRLGVEGATLPEGSTVADWIAFADAQTGKLDASNDRFQSAFGVPGGDGGIIGRCEARDRRAVERSRPKFLGLF